jgi:tetratricopeptide (TPR) repeat protein
MKNYLLSTAVLGTISLFSYISPAVALSPVEVQRIARQSTVQITGCDFGSGVIIRKEGNAYTVLTVAHNLKKSGCAVTAPDEAKYQVDRVKTFPDRVDLAVFTFTSDKVYPVAKLIDNSDRIEAMETIYVSGFPLSTAISTSIFTIVKGDVVANPATKQQGKGYSLIYSNNTLPGHSGGPVWNDRGELIAIHGQGDVDSKSQETMNDGVRVKTGYNLGITVNTFNKLAVTAGVTSNAPVVVAVKPKPLDDLIASAILKLNKRDYRGMLPDLDRAISLLNGSTALDSQNVRLYTLRGIAKSELGDKPGATVDYQRAITFNPTDPAALNGRGVAKAELGDRQGALIDLNRAIAIDPNFYKAYNNRGSIRSELGDNKGAIDDFNRAIALYPNNATAYNDRAVSKFTLGDKQGAVDDYTRAIAIDPTDAATYNNRGLAKYALANKQGALDDFNRAIAINPNYAKAYHSRATTKFSLGDKQGALLDFNRAIEIDRNYAKAYHSRAVTKNDLGDKPGALDDYNRAIAIDPNYAKAYYNRSLLKTILKDKIGAIDDMKRAAQIYQQQGKTAEYQDALKQIERSGL